MPVPNIGKGLADLRKRIGVIDDDLQLSLFDHPRKFGKIASARMHEKVAIAAPLWSRVDAPHLR